MKFLIEFETTGEPGEVDAAMQRVLLAWLASGADAGVVMNDSAQVLGKWEVER